MVKNLVLVFGSFALAAASAANSYNVTFFEPVVVNGTALKPGDYKLELNEHTAILKQGKVVAEAPVKMESGDKKFATNTVRTVEGKIDEIRLGGTRTRLVFEKAGTSTR